MRSRINFSDLVGRLFGRESVRCWKEFEFFQLRHFFKRPRINFFFGSHASGDSSWELRRNKLTKKIVFHCVSFSHWKRQAFQSNKDPSEHKNKKHFNDSCPMVGLARRILRLIAKMPSEKRVYRQLDEASTYFTWNKNFSWSCICFHTGFFHFFFSRVIGGNCPAPSELIHFQNCTISGLFIKLVISSFTAHAARWKCCLF